MHCSRQTERRLIIFIFQVVEQRTRMLQRISLVLLLCTIGAIGQCIECITSPSGFYSNEGHLAAAQEASAHNYPFLYADASNPTPNYIDPYVQQLLSLASFGGSQLYSTPWMLYNSYNYPTYTPQWTPLNIPAAGASSFYQPYIQKSPSAPVTQGFVAFYQPLSSSVSSSSVRGSGRTPSGFHVHTATPKATLMHPHLVLPPTATTITAQVPPAITPSTQTLLDAHEKKQTNTHTPTVTAEPPPELPPLDIDALTTTTTTTATSPIPLYHFDTTDSILGSQQNTNTDADQTTHGPSSHDAKTNTAPASGFPPRCPLIGPDGMDYCFFTDKAKNLPQALSFCVSQGMQLARFTTGNSDFLNRIVDETFPNSSFSCLNKLTIVGNYDVAMRYGSYAYTLGKQCQNQNESNDTSSASTSSSYDICLRLEDCTLVDWLTPRPFFCVTINDTAHESETSTEKFIDLRKFHTIGQWDYYVSTGTANNLLEAVKANAEQPSTSPSPPFVPLDPTCVPAKAGQLPNEVLEALKLDSQMPFKFSVLTQSYNPAGFGRKCVPSCKDEEAQAKLYVVCAKDSQIEVENNTTLHRYAQLWTDGLVFYNISSQFNSTQRQQIIDAMNTIEHVSCVRFEQLSNDTQQNTSTDFISFEPIASPHTCQSLDYGRRVGGGAHVIVFAPECFTRVGHLLRQVMHTLGVPPEHIRFDRDQHIRINHDNIQQNRPIQRYFQKQLLPTIITLRGVPYDFSSVTHWGPEAYAKQTGLKTIETVAQPGMIFGQRERLSQLDIKKLDILYGTQCANTVSQMGNLSK